MLGKRKEPVERLAEFLKIYPDAAEIYHTDFDGFCVSFHFQDKWFGFYSADTLEDAIEVALDAWEEKRAR